MAPIKSGALRTSRLHSSLAACFSKAAAKAFCQNSHRSNPKIGPVKSRPGRKLLYLYSSSASILRGDWTISTKRVCPSHKIHMAAALIQPLSQTSKRDVPGVTCAFLYRSLVFYSSTFISETSSSLSSPPFVELIVALRRNSTTSSTTSLSVMAASYRLLASASKVVSW